MFLVLTLELAQAQPRTLNIAADQHFIALNTHAWYAYDASAKVSIDDWLSDTSNLQFSASFPAQQFGSRFLPGAIWTHLRLRSEQPRRLYLIVDDPRLQSVVLHQVQAGLLLKADHSGTDRPFTERAVSYLAPAFAVDFAGQQTVDILIRSRSETAHLLPLRLKSAQRFQADLVLIYGLLGLGVGMLLVLLIYNLGLLLVVGERSIVSYSFWVASGFAYQASITGFAFQYLWSDNLWWAHRSSNVFAFLCVLAGLLFTQQFLRTAQRLPKTHRLLQICAVGLFIACLLAYFVDFTVISSLSLAVGLIYPLILLGLGLKILADRKSVV